MRSTTHRFRSRSTQTPLIVGASSHQFDSPPPLYLKGTANPPDTHDQHEMAYFQFISPFLQQQQPAANSLGAASPATGSAAPSPFAATPVAAASSATASPSLSARDINAGTYVSPKPVAVAARAQAPPLTPVSAHFVHSGSPGGSSSSTYHMHAVAAMSPPSTAARRRRRRRVKKIKRKRQSTKSTVDEEAMADDDDDNERARAAPAAATTTTATVSAAAADDDDRLSTSADYDDSDDEVDDDDEANGSGVASFEEDGDSRDAEAAADDDDIDFDDDYDDAAADDGDSDSELPHPVNTTSALGVALLCAHFGSFSLQVLDAAALGGAPPPAYALQHHDSLLEVKHLVGDGDEEACVTIYSLVYAPEGVAAEVAAAVDVADTSFVLKMASAAFWHERLRREVAVHGHLTRMQRDMIAIGSPARLVPLLAASVDDARVCLAAPYCAGGSLSQLIEEEARALTVARVTRWMDIALDTLRFIHDVCHCTHGDTHVGNWLVLSERQAAGVALGVCVAHGRAARTMAVDPLTLAAAFSGNTTPAPPAAGDEWLVLFDFDESWPRAAYTRDHNYRLMCALDDANFLRDLAHELTEAARPDLAHHVTRRARRHFIGGDGAPPTIKMGSGGGAFSHKDAATAPPLAYDVTAMVRALGARPEPKRIHRWLRRQLVGLRGARGHRRELSMHGGVAFL